MIVPAAAALIGVPYPTPMSRPSCIRPQRQPNGLVTGPLTGQIRPCDETVESRGPDEDEAWIVAATLRLAGRSPFASLTNSRSLARTSARLDFFEERDLESECVATSRPWCTCRTCAVRTAITRVSDAIPARAVRVLTRARCISPRPRFTSVEMVASWEPIAFA